MLLFAYGHRPTLREVVIASKPPIQLTYGMIEPAPNIHVVADHAMRHSF